MVAGTGKIRTTVEYVHEITLYDGAVAYDLVEQAVTVMRQLVQEAGGIGPINIEHVDGKLVLTGLLRIVDSHDDVLSAREEAMARAHKILWELEQDRDHDDKIRLRIRDARVALQNGGASS